jgi:hypothetical protein
VNIHRAVKILALASIIVIGIVFSCEAQSGKNCLEQIYKQARQISGMESTFDDDFLFISHQNKNMLEPLWVSVSRCLDRALARNRQPNAKIKTVWFKKRPKTTELCMPQNGVGIAGAGPNKFAFNVTCLEMSHEEAAQILGE